MLTHDDFFFFFLTLLGQVLWGKKRTQGEARNSALLRQEDWESLQAGRGCPGDSDSAEDKEKLLKDRQGQQAAN